LRETHENGINLCGAHHPLSPHSADFRSFLIAYFAIMNALFALAQILRKRKKEPAFQASSPKNFQRAGFDRPSFLRCAPRGGRRYSNFALGPAGDLQLSMELWSDWVGMGRQAVFAPASASESEPETPP
jgi:hypothetical protein